MIRSLRYVLATLIAIASHSASRGNLSAAQTPPTVSVATLRVTDNAWRHFNRAKTAAQHGREAESERESLTAIKISPGFAEAYLLLAGMQIRAHNYEAALANIQSARGFDPAIRWSSILLAGAYNGLGRFAEARTLLAAMQGADANSWQADYERARAETGLANSADALRWSEAALIAAPQSFADAHLVRANAFLLARRWSDAITQMNQYLQSREPQPHRSDVLAAIETAIRNRDQEQRSALHTVDLAVPGNLQSAGSSVVSSSSLCGTTRFLP